MVLAKIQLSDLLQLQIFQQKPGRCLIIAHRTFSQMAVFTIIQKFVAEIFQTHKKNTLPLTETRKRKGVELVILLSYQSQHVRTSKANTSCHSARHLKHF